MSTKLSTRTGDIKKFEIFQAKDGGKSIDALSAVVDIKYYEDVLSNTVSLSAIIAEAGETDDNKVGNVGILDGLPVRGGEPVTLIIEDHDGNKLRFAGDNKLYINRVRNVIPGTQKDVYVLDLSPRELFANEQCRVVKRYNGKISENIKKILTEATSADVGIKTKKKVNVDETALEYNFIGNDRKPFYVCTWLASKSIPDATTEDGKSEIGGAAGYLFFQTRDGYHFKSIDKIFTGEPKKKFIFNNSTQLPEGYDAKVLTYDINSDIDVGKNLMMGMYNNRSIFFDPLVFNYEVRSFPKAEVPQVEGDIVVEEIPTEDQYL